jgi:hypothetical protein
MRHLFEFQEHTVVGSISPNTARFASYIFRNEGISHGDVVWAHCHCPVVFRESTLRSPSPRVDGLPVVEGDMKMGLDRPEVSSELSPSPGR